jgi:radical SAM protein with 4Fe4S-binding SPASM domain
MGVLNVFNPFVKTVARWYLKKTPEGKKKFLFSSMSTKILMSLMGVNRSDLKDLESDEEFIPLVDGMFQGMARFGFKAIQVGVPLYVVFDITGKCNLKCIHCYSSKQNNEVSTREVYHILRMLYESGAGLVDFGGGEPLLRGDIFDIISYSKKLGLYTSISTNGTLLNDDNIKRLKTLNIDHICISLDGVKSEIHDYVRNKKGTFEKTIKGIKNCVKEGLNTQISTVIMKSNLDELDDLYDLLKKLGVNEWYVYDFVPAGRGNDLKKEVLSPVERRNMFMHLQDIAFSSKINIKPYPYSITVNSACEKDTFFYTKYGKLTEFFKGCLTGRWMCHISNNGDIHPCHLLPFKLGNLKQEKFSDIWFSKNNKVLNDLRDRTLLKGNCNRCEYRDVCGGCRAQAYWRTGDYLEGDNCWVKN